MPYLEVFLAAGGSRSSSPLVGHYWECIEYE